MLRMLNVRKIAIYLSALPLIFLGIGAWVMISGQAAAPLGDSRPLSGAGGRSSADMSALDLARVSDDLATRAEVDRNYPTNEFVSSGSSAGLQVSEATASGAVSFTQSSFSVNEGDGRAAVTLTRTGSDQGEVVAHVTLADVTTSPADYRFSPGGVDPTFNRGSGQSALFNSQNIVLQSDGKALIGGNNYIIRVNTDGSVDPTFTAGQLNGGVHAVAMQPDGKIIISGSFTTIDAVRKNRIARLHADGSLDTTFDAGTGPSDWPNAMVVQPDGKIIIGGLFLSVNGTQRFQLARLNTDGSLDSSFVSHAGIGTIYAIALQPDGKILVGGAIGLRRLNSDGSVDNTFAANISRVVLALALQTDGKIIAGGSFDRVSGQVIYNLARLHADGSLDTTFNTGSGPDQAVSAVTVQPDGKVIIGGYFKSFNGVEIVNLARLHSGGSLDTTFRANVIGSGTAIGIIIFQPDGRLLVGGNFAVSSNGSVRSNVARLENDLFVSWRAGDTADKTISLPLVDDLLDEPDETLDLTLAHITNGATTGMFGSASLTIIDNDVPPTFTSELPPAASVGALYNHTFAAAGSPATMTFSVTAGTLPPGFWLSSTGLLSGVTYTAGTYNSITVTASNGVAPAATQTFNLRVNGPATANNDNYEIDEDTTLIIAAPGVLSNDTDAEGDPLQAALVSPPPLGAVTLSADGSFSYTPRANFNGTDRFYYRVNDGHLNSNTATVTVTVRPVNDAPANSVPSPQTTLENTPLRFSASTGNLISFTDIDAGFSPFKVTLTATNGTLTLPSISGLSFSVGDGSSDATMTLTGTLPTINSIIAGLLFTPSTGFVGEASLQIIADDQGHTGSGGALTDTDTVRITVLPGGKLQFSSETYTLGEGDGAATLTVTRTGDISTAVSVAYATQDGTATQRADYTLAIGTLRFAAGQTSASLTVPITDDSYLEGTEGFTITLSNPAGAASLGTPVAATVNLLDNDSAGAANPIDTDADYFVTQHYRDFLNRQPDEGGLAFWTAEITSCDQIANPQQRAFCIENKRNNVSAAFFLSIEFQETGYLVYRFYLASLPETPGRPRAFPRYLEFMRDTQEIGRGVSVGISGWQEQLAANQQAFAEAWVGRAEFMLLYPETMTPAQYVDALYSRANVVPTAAGRQAAINEFNNPAGGLRGKRARALRRVVENETLRVREFNRAFVLMQYFGYLRRNPDEFPDTDFGGYDFWLAKLNEFNGNFIQSQMVLSFLLSTEYRGRFGQP